MNIDTPLTCTQYEELIAARRAMDEELSDMLSQTQQRREENKRELKALVAASRAVQIAQAKLLYSYDWHDLMEAEPETTERHRLRQLAMKNRFPGTMVRFSGYNVDTLQMVLELSFNEETTECLPELASFLENEMIPVIKPRQFGKDALPGRAVKLMEPSLSAGGSHYIVVYHDRVDLMNFRSTRGEVRASRDNVLSMLQHLQEHYAFSAEDY